MTYSDGADRGQFSPVLPPGWVLVVLAIVLFVLLNVVISSV